MINLHRSISSKIIDQWIWWSGDSSVVEIRIISWIFGLWKAIFNNNNNLSSFHTYINLFVNCQDYRIVIAYPTPTSFNNLSIRECNFNKNFPSVFDRWAGFIRLKISQIKGKGAFRWVTTLFIIFSEKFIQVYISIKKYIHTYISHD